MSDEITDGNHCGDVAFTSLTCETASCTTQTANEQDEYFANIAIARIDYALRNPGVFDSKKKARA